MCNTEEARKASLKLSAVYMWSQTLLDTNNIFDLTASDSAVVADSASATDSAAATNSAAPDCTDSNPAATRSATPITSSKPITLPGVVIKEVFTGHKCQYIDCQPDTRQQLYDMARDDLLDAQVASIKETREKIFLEARAKEFPEIRSQVRGEYQNI